MRQIIVIGGGAAGMMAAVAAANAGANVTILEKNDRLGKKLYITGKGRCNITNMCDYDRFFDAVTTNKKFMYSAFYGLTNDMVVDFLNSAGLPTKVERGDRVFPVSDKSSDVIGVFKTLINRNENIDLRLGAEVIKVDVCENSVAGVTLKSGEKLYADAVIIATGGVCYPLTGSTGDGYTFAKKCGHNVVEAQPSLVPFNVKENFCKDVMGLALKNVKLTVTSGKKKVFEEQGELLFTHFGISGPLVIKASAYMHKFLDKDVNLEIDLKPALSNEQLDDRVLKDFSKYANKNFNNALGDLLPAKLIDIVIEKTGIDPYKKVNSITREERENLVHVLKHFTLTFTGLRDFNEAIITNGGVNVKEVDASTMESKLVKGLYFAGEVLDVDALTGGYNLQIAWSTGHLAGISGAQG